MKEEKFKVIQFIRELIIRVDKELENFPKKDIEIKNKIRNESYDLLEIAYEANNTSRREHRKALLEKGIAKIKVIDFLLNLSYDKQLITSKKYLKCGIVDQGNYREVLDRNKLCPLVNDLCIFYDLQYLT